MVSSNVNDYSKRLYMARIRLLNSNGFYGLLLTHVKFSLDLQVETAATDGETIYFDPRFLDRISDNELIFVLMHEILHIVLQHCVRVGTRDVMLFNIATDIVVNSNILHSNHMDLSKIRCDGNISMHIAPNGQEGYLYTAEEVYDMLIKEKKKDFESFDNHTKWSIVFNKQLSDKWIERVVSAANIMKSNFNGFGLPLGIERLLNELKEPKLNWKEILYSFINEETNDYSLLPPDKRFIENNFFLPDFSDKDSSIKNLLFMIDTSASMDNQMISDCYAEIKGAIEQFNGKLEGYVGFFDTIVIEPKPFSDINELLSIKPVGGGGTDFGIIFDYIKEKMDIEKISTIVILTDGYACFPKEECAMGIPVLWVINNEDSNPGWGKVARI